MNNIKAVNIIIDKKCNQKCKYCEHAHHKYQNRSDDDIFNSFDIAMNKLEELFGKYRFRPQLQGGEPTLLSDSLIDRICDRLKGYGEVLVFSNGHNRYSRFYTEKGYKVVTHIIDWYRFDISKFPLLENETLAFCITHDEICRVDRLISTASGKEKILLLPCWSDNLTWNCTREDKIYLKKLQDEYDGLELNEDIKDEDFCSSMRIPIVDCSKLTISPCGFIEKQKELETVSNEELENIPCEDEGCGYGKKNYRKDFKRRIVLTTN